MEFNHYSVMLGECIEGLAIKPDGIYVDATAGGGGHSEQIAKRLTTGHLIAIDRDEEAVKTAGERLLKYPCAKVYHDRFSRMAQLLTELNINGVDGILIDCGVSSHQLDETGRGFSYKNEAEVDMRMDQSRGLSAREVINTYKKEDLARIFFEYGEERFSRRIADAICDIRAKREIKTTTELADIIKNAMPAAARSEKGHPAKRCFQALRIEVNDELGELAAGLEAGWQKLNHGGRMVILTFHSLEDRMTKRFYKDKITDCICPPEFPICVCNHRAEGHLITKKPMLPSQNELDENPRSASAKLRIIEKL